MAGWSIPGVVHPREICEDSVGRRVVARHQMTRRSLAITYVSPELLADTEFRTRFTRESARLARVRDSRVARVHRYVECEHGAAVIGDHVHGTPLRALLLAHGVVGLEAALVLLTDSLRALARCHEAGLAHGDVKPEDVVVTSTGRIRLVDFGLWTSGGRRVLGRSTPFYLAPEHWSDGRAHSAGDVYAATVTFFECLVGAPPFYAEDAAELSIKHQRSAVPIDVVPEPVRDLILRGLAKDPVSRSDARSLLARIDEVAVRAVGAGWARRGRRELTTLLGGRGALFDRSAVARRSARAGSARPKPVRLAAVMGGALALAAGLSSPPLAVILPGISMFTPGGSSPVLAFPEPDQSAVPVRAVINGALADRMPPAKPATRTPVADAQPSAPSISAQNADPVPYRHPIADALTHGSANQDQSGLSPSASTPTPGCDQELIDHKLCSVVNPEQPAASSDGTASDPAEMIPVSVSTPIQSPVKLLVPVKIPVQLPAQGQLPKLILIQKKIQARESSQAPKDAQIKADSRGWKGAPSGQGATGTMGYSSSRGHGDSESSGHGRSAESSGTGSGHGNRGR